MSATGNRLVELASRLSFSGAVETLQNVAAAPGFEAAAKRVATEFVSHGVLFGILFYHFSMKWCEHYFADRSHYEKRKPFWKALMAGYNMLLSLYSAVTFVVSLRALSALGMYGAGGGCDHIFSDPWFEWAAKLFYFSKYTEFADTWFLVIAGKPVSWLQYFHHAGACLDMWVLYNYHNEGIWIFVQFNSFIHTIMYAYFACTAMGINVPGKQIVTLLQILQLTIGNSLSFPYLNQSCYAADPLRMIGWGINFVYINCLVVLFVHFAVTTYILAPAKGGKGGKGKAAKVVVTADGANGKAVNGKPAAAAAANGTTANGTGDH